ncbi:periplasmic protein TonB [Pseudomonas mediterranea]
MRKTILIIMFLPAIALGQTYIETNLKALEDANGVSYWGGLSRAFASNQNQELNWFKNKGFELDKEFAITTCGDGLCYISESSGRLRVAVKQQEGDFNGRKLQGQFVRVVGTDMYGTLVIERLTTIKKIVNQPVKQPSTGPTPVPTPVSPKQENPDLTVHFDELVKSRASEGWARPPSARQGMVVELEININPDGIVTSVDVAKTSGDLAFDKSAVAAVKNIGRLTEMQGMEPSDMNRFKSFKMNFTPEDLAL